MSPGAPPDDPEFEPPTKRPMVVMNVGEDGVTHRYQWNAATKAYDIDLGPVKRPPSESPQEEP